MWINKVPVDVWKYTVGSGFVPETYVYTTTVSGTFMPLSGGSSIRNNQAFADVKKLLVCNIIYKGVLTDKDEVEYDNEWFRVITVENYENIIPHVEIYLGDSQWRRT